MERKNLFSQKCVTNATGNRTDLGATNISRINVVANLHPPRVNGFARNVNLRNVNAVAHLLHLVVLHLLPLVKRNGFVRSAPLLHLHHVLLHLPVVFVLMDTNISVNASTLT